MKGRILVSVSAWLAGAAVATSGTLVAVSWIGQGISTTPVRTLSVDQVDSALAQVSPSTQDSPQESSASASASASPSAAPSVSPSASAAPTTSAPRTLTSAGGSVIAVCTASGAYLTSWSPAQNYQVAAVRRGPAPIARVIFQSGLSHVYLGAVCHSGVPTAFSGESESTGPDE
ncbi:MAG TPA: hypothetical protein VGZ32_04830 [Actinocrinis sp.]|nr:hypothetical protein [Actinocrinis sp.]